jgi:Trypsin-like peptidase domain
VKTLTAEEREALVKLLASAVDFDQLDTYVYLGTGDRLFTEFVGPGLPLRPTLRKLIDGLELGPITDRFLRVVYREKPFQAALRAYIASLYPDIPAAAGREALKFEFQKSGAAVGAQSEGPGLERLVKPNLKFIDAQVWLSRFETIKRQVCRVEVDGGPLGTGFLVGPRAVVTNWHVVKAAREQGRQNTLACRFDYRRLADGGVSAGTSIPVASVADERPCSSAELTKTPDDPPPAPNELDYALLELRAPVTERGYLKLADPPPAARSDPLIIVQHPSGDPLQFAIDQEAIIGLVHGGLRLRYSTNTAPGSSGSPCFNMDWNLLALHHLGDPGASPSPYNQGVPVDLIRKSIGAGASASLLGE